MDVRSLVYCIFQECDIALTTLSTLAVSIVKDNLHFDGK